MILSEGLKQFSKAFSLPDERVDLVRVALGLAEDVYSDLPPIKHYLTQLAGMARRAAGLMPSTATDARQQVLVLNEYLFGDQEFTWGRDELDDADLWYLQRVMDRRRGTSLTLGIVYMALGRRLGLPLTGVTMPGHFILRLEGTDLFIDPADHGSFLLAEDCQERISEIYGVPVEMRPEYLAPASNRLLAHRLLNGLKAVYLRAYQFEPVVPVLYKLLVLNPRSPDDVRDLGIVKMHMGDLAEALELMERYVDMAPDDLQAPLVQQYVDAINRQMEDRN